MKRDVDANDTLRQQFQQLQEQHQRKLFLRKQRLSHTNHGKSENGTINGRDVHSTPNSQSGPLEDEIDDNLRLELDNNCGDDVVAQQSSDWENSMRELKDENGRLYKLVAERDEEMRILRKQVDEEKQALIGSGVASDTAANRIMELSKKNRELSSDVEKERRKVRQLSKKLSELQCQSSLTSAQASFNKDTKNEKLEEKNSADEERASLKVLQEKLKQAQAKMAEYRNQCEILKKEARLAQKVIAKECGEGVNMTAILNEPSGWRGRQQQITTLQNKVNELMEQLTEVSKLKSVQPSNALSKPGLGIPRITTPSFHDQKHKQMLRMMEKNKKEAYEKISGELQILMQEHDKLQAKFDAAKTRNKILTNELKGLKTQSKMLVEKGIHDDELIAALMREQERLKKALEKKNSQISEKSQPRQHVVHQDSELVQTLTRLCKEREEKVAKLESDLKTMVSDMSQRHSPSFELADKATTTDEIDGDHPSVRNSFPDYLPHAENDSCNSIVYNINAESSSHRRRIVRSSGRNSSSSSLPPTPPRSGSGKRKNSAVSRDGRCHSASQFEEYRSLYEATKVERDKLVELVSVLQQREKEVRMSVSKTSSDVKSLQRQNVELEKKLARTLAGQNPHPRQEKTRKPKTAHRQAEGLGEDLAVEPYVVEELETQLAIQKDENDALKEALEAALHGKKKDFSFYQDIIEQTKQVFLKGIHQYRQTSAPA